MSGLYIVLVVVTAIILVAVTIIAYKKSSTHAYVSWVVKKHPKQLAVLLGHPSASVNDLSFTKEENKKINYFRNTFTGSIYPHFQKKVLTIHDFIN